MKPLTYRIRVLGCRVNHAETRELESLLLERGLTAAGASQPANLEVVHSCSVTGSAAAKSRHALRQAMRRQHAASLRSSDRDPAYACHSKVIVTGCYAGTNPREAEAIVGDDADVIAQHANDDTTMAHRFAAQIDRWLAEIDRPGDRPPDLAVGDDFAQRFSPRSQRAILPLPIVRTHERARGHVRAELRIQDGCDAHCTFCIIPRIRRTLRSKRVEDAVSEARRLVELGHGEIVLSGVFIGAFGHETALRRKQRNRFASPLADLVDAVAQVPGLHRLRISSMEPGDVDELLLDAMAANAPTVTPHLHLPLQSGSDAVLRRMNRQYRVGDYLDMIEQVNEALTINEPGHAPLPPAITTDIICGFPGETESDFEQTIAAARRVGYLHMHVFPYSPRQGTAAARWRDQFVDDRTRKRRVRTLIDLETDPVDGLAINFRRRLLGRTVRVIIEQPVRDRPGWVSGRCDHYDLVHLPQKGRRGDVVSADIQSIETERTVGQCCETIDPIRLSVLN